MSSGFGTALFDAQLNGAAAVLLVLGWSLIRSGRVRAHRACMVSAFTCSCVFLASYLYYHAHAGVVHYKGTGLGRAVYFPLLISHTVLAAAIVPMVLRTLYLALSKRFEEHRRAARWTFPAWLYVSVTGVIVYRMLFG